MPDLDLQKYRSLLVEALYDVRDRLRRKGIEVQELDEESDMSIGDLGIDDVVKDDDFAEADLEWRVLRQIQGALRRIRTGTYGKCDVDGQTIPEQRLEAIPWTRYCVQHEQELEIDLRTPTL